MVCLLILYPSKDWLFWVMTASVIFGLVLGLLLGLAPCRCSLQLVKQAHLKNPLQARKVACFLGEMHDYFG